ncbi:TPA: glutamate racemase [Candidatus Saccharibacteria bacterium]|nr:glutamate racemase [Candidatus Saccharibacteria bacterium]HRK41292.1 aspartate/glutamate racemase family protein [Candidatus Saccharibacteria bacterium]
MKLGIFDSGIGGEAVAASLKTAFPEADFMLADDRAHLPYGDRSAEDITQLTDAAIQPLLEGNCDIIVIACNSATAAAIETLRERYPTQTFIGLEPMIKPAAELTKTGVIAVCATPATLASERYHRLKANHAENLTVIEPDCSSWARMIEENDLNEDNIEQTIESVIAQKADVIVLACTHYHWIREVIEEVAADRAEVLVPSDAIARRVSSILNKE